MHVGFVSNCACYEGGSYARPRAARAPRARARARPVDVGAEFEKKGQSH